MIFDFDGVIVDSEACWHRACSEVLAEFGVVVSAEEYAREWVSLGRGPEIAVERHGLPVTAEELRRRRAPIVERLVGAEGVPRPGALPALERLSARFPLALATNSWGRVVGPFLEKHGLARFFGGRLLTKECYARSKPAPDAYLAAAAALGLPPSRCVVVEDAEKGVLAAHAAGARCIAVPDWWTEEGDLSTADRIVPSLDDVTADLVEAVLAEPPARIREAVAADREGIHAAHLAAIREIASSSYSPEDIEAWTTGRTPERVPIGKWILLVAEDPDGIAGFAEASVADREVRAVYVHPRRSGRGVGARLLSAVERRLRDSGVVVGTLAASLNAVRFYERRGWIRGADERHSMPSGREIACVRMTKRLIRGPTA